MQKLVRRFGVNSKYGDGLCCGTMVNQKGTYSASLTDCEAWTARYRVGEGDTKEGLVGQGK